MCKLIRCYFLLLFCCCFLEVPSAEAQRDEGALKFKHFTSANGLSQRSVMAILQDKTGYQWFGTRDGLNKFDGNRFIVYRHDAANPKSLSNNNIHSLYQDNYGNLWVGTQTGLNKYNPRTDDFTRYGAADYTVRAIIQISKEYYGRLPKTAFCRLISARVVTHTSKVKAQIPILSATTVPASF